MKDDAKQDSLEFLKHLTWLIDKLSESLNIPAVRMDFIQKSLRILSQSRHILWRPHWLKLRRHILEKLRETEENTH